MKPFHQGKLDIFCAMYAVLNGLRLTHSIRTLHAREIFHETLLALAPNTEAFRVVLEQRTDYVALVDGMLNVQMRRLPLRVEKPFADAKGDTIPSPQVLWQRLHHWLQGDNKAVVFRFLRHLSHDAPAVNKHWTTGQKMENNVLHFFDCSHEQDAVYRLTQGEFVTRPEDICPGKLVCIEPHAVRFIASTF